MDSVVTCNKFVSHISGSPASLQNESGYGSMGRVFRSPVQDSDMSDYKECSFTYTTDKGYGKRTLSIETIKRKLFASSPYVPEGKQLQKLPGGTPTPLPVGKINQNILKVTEEITEKLHVETPIKEHQAKRIGSPVAVARKRNVEPSPFKSPIPVDKTHKGIGSPAAVVRKKRNVEQSPFKSPIPVNKTHKGIGSPVAVSRKNVEQSLIPVDKTHKEPQPKCTASPYMKFYYTPVKNSKNFRNPTPSPVRSVVPETNKTPSSKWPSFGLPEKRRDMLKKLYKRQMKDEVSSILSMLSDEDIFRVGCVSRTWRKIVESDAESKKRRRNYMCEKKVTKENRRIAQCKENTLGGTLTDGDREILMDLCNQRFFKPTFPKVPKSKSDYFLEVAKSIPKSEVILKCPMCQYPAKCVIGQQFHCTHASCSYKFCKQCFTSHAPTVACPAQAQSIPKVIIGSKKSKRNLKRL